MRHRWVRLREHTRICTQCGCGKVNRELGRNQWETTYHTPDGVSQVRRYTPDCAPGPLTEKYLGKYAADIAELT